MEPNKIEKHFKEQLNAREIKPSEMAWDRLDAMLAVAEKKPKRNFRWMYVAASFLGFLLLGTLYFNKNNKEEVVPNEIITVIEPKIEREIKAHLSKINLIKNVEQPKVTKEQLVSAEIKLETDLNKNSPETEKQVTDKEIIQESILSIINQKAEQPEVLQKSRYVNVDELLASVDNTSQKKSSLATKSNVKVNSNELLSQVDGELDLTFREKAIKTVNQNFKTVKLALSNRNSE